LEEMKDDEDVDKKKETAAATPEDQIEPLQAI